MNNVLSFESHIDVENIEKINKDFSKAECQVMYVDANRNNSFITKETVEKNIGTIYNIPVIAEVLYKEGEDKDFGTHGGRLIIDSNGMRIEQTTVPYGVVPESCNPRWVKKEDKEYLVCDIYLWTERYDDLEILLSDEEKQRPQSMEITIKNSFVDEDGYEVIEDFSFSALTILGTDVEPCFEDARVKMYERDKFKEEYEKLFNLYNATKFESINIDNKEEKGGEIMSKKNVVKEDNKKNEKKFELSYRDKMDILHATLGVEYSSKDDWVWIVDFTNEHVDYQIETLTEEKYQTNIYRATYSLNEEEKTAVVDFENKEEMIMELITQAEKDEIESNKQMAMDNLNEKINSLESDLGEFKIENDELNSKNEDLKVELEKEKKFRIDINEKERKEKIDIMINSFENTLSNNPEFNVIKDKAHEMELNEIENACYVLIGKANFSKKKTTKDDKKAYTSLGLEIEDSDEESIADKIEKEYSSKKKIIKK